MVIDCHYGPYLGQSREKLHELHFADCDSRKLYGKIIFPGCSLALEGFLYALWRETKYATMRRRSEMVCDKSTDGHRCFRLMVLTEDRSVKYWSRCDDPKSEHPKMVSRSWP
jgi:hypothetical protein